MTKLAGTTINLSSQTSRVVVGLVPGSADLSGEEFDILDFNSAGLTIFGGVSNLLNLLSLPVDYEWDTTQFISAGKITALRAAVAADIGTHPISQIVQQLGSVTFSVVPTGTNPISYQWRKNGFPIDGATQSSLTLTGVTQDSEAAYTVKVSNPKSEFDNLLVVSDPATLTVNWPLSFAVNLPATRQASKGLPITFKVVLDGENPTYQWMKGESIISGATNASHTIVNAQDADAGTYKVVVSTSTLVPGPGNTPNVVTSAVMTLSVAEGVPVVTAQPDSASMEAGGDLELVGGGGGGTGATLQWFRNGVAVPGATSATLKLCGISVLDAGDYTFKITSIGPLGKPITVTSVPPASIMIVDNSAKILAGQLGKSVSMTVNAGLPPKVKATYQWLKNGAPVPLETRFVGSGTKTLKINSLIATDTAVYTCRVTGPAGTVPAIGGKTRLRVYSVAPQLVKTTPPPAAIVGGVYSWKIPVVSDALGTLDSDRLPAWLGTPATYAVSGLPSGLKVDKLTGIISGYPTTATNTIKNPSGYPIKITVSNLSKPGLDTWSTLIDVKPLPVGVAGVYAGAISRADSNGNLGGRFDMTVTNAGSISGKITLGGAAARSFKGGFNITLNNLGDVTGLVSASIKVPASKTAAPVMLNFSLENLIVAPAVPATMIVNATMSDCGPNLPAAFTGWRNKWAAKAVTGISEIPTPYLGLYNFAMTLPTGSPLISNPRIPQGAGYAAFTVAPTGLCTIAGRTADGEIITSACPVGPTGQLFVFRSLYATTVKGSILSSTLTIEANADVTKNDLIGALDWVRPPNPLAVTTRVSRLYRMGFGSTRTISVSPVPPGDPITTPVSLIAFGGRYLPPLSVGPEVILGITPSTSLPPPSNAALSFTEVNDLDVASATNPNVAVTVIKGSATTTPVLGVTNPAATKCAARAATGAFSGSFTLLDPSALIRKVTFQGLIVRRRTSALNDINRTERIDGFGYFINSQISSPTATAPQISGMVSLEKNP